MLLQQLKAIKKIKELRRYHCQYRYQIYQASLCKIEAELALNEEKRLNEIKLRKAYEASAYGELGITGATIGRLSQIRNEVKSMLFNERAIEAYLKDLIEIYDLNEQELQKIKNELLMMEKKLEGIDEINAIAMKNVARTTDYQVQDDNDDFAIANYIKNL